MDCYLLQLSLGCHMQLVLSCFNRIIRNSGDYSFAANLWFQTSYQITHKILKLSDKYSFTQKMSQVIQLLICPKYISKLGLPILIIHEQSQGNYQYIINCMNYLSKVILQQLLPQFVEIPQGGLKTQQSGIKLAKGAVRRKKINPILENIGLRVDECSYTNIFLEIPWLQIYKKPIKITIQQLQGEVSLLEMDTISSDSSIPEQTQVVPNNPSVSGEYLRSILKKLLLNMEMTIKSINFGVKNHQSINLSINIQNMTIKNSKLSQDSKDVIKTIVIQKISICLHSKPIFEFRRFNLCLDIGQQHLKVICLVNAVFLMVNINEFKMIRGSLDQFVARPRSRNGSQISIESEQKPNSPTKKQVNPDQKKTKTIDFYFKLFQFQLVFLSSASLQLNIVSKNIQLSYNNKFNTKTKFSFQYFQVLQRQKVVFAIRSSKKQGNKSHFINYAYLQQKAIVDPEVQIENLSQQHTSIKLYYVELYGNNHLFQILKLHLKTLIVDIDSLLNPPFVSQQQILVNNLSQQSVSCSTVTTITIYQGILEIEQRQQSYKLYLSVQFVIDNGCLYQFDTLQISIRNRNIQILKVYDSDVSITQDDIYIKVELIQIQLWMSSIHFFKNLVNQITQIVASFQTKTQQINTSNSRQKLTQLQTIAIQPQNKKQKAIKYLILIRNTKITLGNTLSKVQSYKFIDLLDVSIKDSKIIISDNGALQCSLSLCLTFTDQQTLLQQAISNNIYLSFENTNGKDKSIQLLNNVSIKLQSRYLKYLINTLNNIPSYISVINFTKNKLKIGCQGCASIVLEYKVAQYWFPLIKTFRLESVQGKHHTCYMSLDFMVDNDTNIQFNDSNERAILRLVKTKDAQYHLLIKPVFKMVNCYRNLRIINQNRRINIQVGMCNYLEIDLQHEQSLLMKSVDISDLQNSLDLSGDEGLMFQDDEGRNHTMKQIVSKEEVILYALNSIDHNNFCCYAMKKNNILILMPFISIKNSTNQGLKIIIQQKKTSNTIQIMVPANSEIVPQNSKLFDFYMRQITIKVSSTTHQSESYYFNTFAFLSEPHQQLIPLRSTQKGIMDKRYITIKQTSKLRSKFIQLINPTTIINQCQFHIGFRLDQRGVVSNDKLTKIEKSNDICVALKNDSIIQVFFQQQLQTKVSLEISKLKENAYIVSFNFCRIKEDFKNILVICELHKVGQHQTLAFRPFITLMNLTQLSLTLDHSQIKPNQTVFLPMVVNSDNNFNNRCIKLQSTTASQIFSLVLKNMESKKGQNQNIRIGTSTICLYDFINKTFFQVTSLPNKTILRLVKDTNKKISLYVIQGIHSDSPGNFLRYSLIANNTQNYFLISEEPVFQGLFEQSHDKHSLKLSKLLIEPHTASTFIVKNNYNIFLCNQRGEKLNELNSQSMALRMIQQEKHTFQNIQTKIFEEKPKQEFRGQQFRSQSLQFQLSFEGDVLITVSIKDLKIRKLQKSKFDLLFHQLIVKDIKKNVNVIGLLQNSYAILDLNMINSSTILIRNMFVKLSLVEIDLRKQFLLNVIRFAKNINKDEPKPYTANNKIQKDTQSREQSLIDIVKSKLFLVKNMFIEEFNIKLNIQFQALAFSNQLTMPIHKLSSSVIRSKKLLSELWKFYSSSLISKFPKLSFLLQNLKHPLNILKNIYNLRQSLKSKTIQKLTYWNYATKYSSALLANQLSSNQTIACIINSIDRIIILSNRSLLLQQYAPIPCRANRFLLSSIRKIQYKNSFIEVQFIQGNRMEISMTKRDQMLFNSVISYLLE